MSSNERITTRCTYLQTSKWFRPSNAFCAFITGTRVDVKRKGKKKGAGLVLKQSLDTSRCPGAGLNVWVEGSTQWRPARGQANYSAGKGRFGVRLDVIGGGRRRESSGPPDHNWERKYETGEAVKKKKPSSGPSRRVESHHRK